MNVYTMLTVHTYRAFRALRPWILPNVDNISTNFSCQSWQLLKCVFYVLVFTSTLILNKSARSPSWSIVAFIIVLMNSWRQWWTWFIFSMLFIILDYSFSVLLYAFLLCWSWSPCTYHQIKKIKKTNKHKTTLIYKG